MCGVCEDGGRQPVSARDLLAALPVELLGAAQQAAFGDGFRPALAGDDGDGNGGDDEEDNEDEEEDDGDDDGDEEACDPRLQEPATAVFLLYTLVGCCAVQGVLQHFPLFVFS